MKKLVSMMVVLMLLVLSLALAGCGAKQEEKTDSDYEAYDGYAYYQANGDLKYSLETKDGLKMHCFFQEDSPEYVEEVYTIDLTTADKQDNILTVHNVTDGDGNDISSQFKSLTYTFEKDQVTMKVQRDESTLAGGESGSVMTGDYVFKEASAKSGASASSGSASSAAGSSYNTDELARAAQDYYRAQNGYCPPEYNVTTNANGTYTIQLYEVVKNGDGTSHTATSAWFTVNDHGVGTNDTTGESVNLLQ